MSIQDYVVEFNLRLTRVKSHAIALPEEVLAYYLLTCANLTSEQSSLCRATCTTLTYDAMKTQIERVTSAHEATSDGAACQVPVEPQFLAAPHPHVEDHAPYEEDYAHYEDIDEADEVDDAFYSRPSPAPPGGRPFPSAPHRNPVDEFGNPSPCRFCKSIYHWVDRCPDAPITARRAGGRRTPSRDHPRRGGAYSGRGRGRGRGNTGGGVFPSQYQF